MLKKKKSHLPECLVPALSCNFEVLCPGVEDSKYVRETLGFTAPLTRWGSAISRISPVPEKKEKGLSETKYLMVSKVGLQCCPGWGRTAKVAKGQKVPPS